MFLYWQENNQNHRQPWGEGTPIPSHVVWLDLISPTPEEEAAAEAFLGGAIPTREEMKEIELSNRLYREGGALFMTATMLSKVSTGMPVTHPATFILMGERLVTIRYVDTTSFQRFVHRILREESAQDGASLLVQLLDTIVNREADILERLDHDIDAITKEIFHFRADPPHVRSDYREILNRIGRSGDLASKTHESLITFSRVLGFLIHHPRDLPRPMEEELLSIQKDIQGLSDHGTYLTGKVNFLLDATLGMINIDQNSVFRVLSTASLIFMPPTLLAGIYGMNFKFMPELEWHIGYPMAILLMLLVALLPYAVMKRLKLL